MFGGDVLEACRTSCTSSENELRTAGVEEGEVGDYAAGDV